MELLRLSQQILPVCREFLPSEQIQAQPFLAGRAPKARRSRARHALTPSHKAREVCFCSSAQTGSAVRRELAHSARCLLRRREGRWSRVSGFQEPETVMFVWGGGAICSPALTFTHAAPALLQEQQRNMNSSINRSAKSRNSPGQPDLFVIHDSLLTVSTGALIPHHKELWDT